ncbi:MAG: YrdB family protein [Burkholderiaceae bacterium]
MSTLNLALRFTLELCALAALAFWGAHVDASRPATITLAILAPLIAAFAWGMFVSPKAQIRAPGMMRLSIELAVFLAAAGGLVAAGEIGWAIAFSAAVIVHELWRLAELRR